MEFLLLANRHPASSPLLANGTPARRAIFAMAEQNEYQLPEQQHWRNEVSSRLRQHRARRRGEKISDTMELDFSAPVSALTEASTKPARRLPKIIRFPSTEPEPDFFPPMPFDAAEDRGWHNLPLESQEPPRIIEAEESPVAAAAPAPAKPAEQMELLPSFDDIQLEASERRPAPMPENSARPAPLKLRAIAAVIDAGLVLFAAVIFGITFRQVADGLPHAKLAPLFALAIVGSLWMLYQYVFLVHSSGTPGMFLSQLELVTFDGKRPRLLSRRCRALACALSAGSLGLGYGWALIDEDQLGWHDRMTQTLLRECSQQEPPEAWF
jgi:uncharacterized RDD family membrane protein YckC